MTSESLMAKDLAASGLEQSDLNARPLEASERAMTLVQSTVQGYVIPYFTIEGKLDAHYRVKLFDFDPKYKQPKDSPNYIYFPKHFQKAAVKCPYILVTEGEKKAALAVKMGIAAVALGGVDSWRNRSISIPKTAELFQGQDKIRAKLPSGGEITEDQSASVATGFQELIDFALHFDKHIIMAYDSDVRTGTKASIQRAAAALGFELRFRGVPFNRIRQIILPVTDDLATTKLGLDDYILKYGVQNLRQLIDTCVKKRSAFPKHPALRDFINKRLQKPKLSRKDSQSVSIAILSDLDSNGIRLRSGEALQSYYFDFVSRKLLKADFGRHQQQHDTAFGQFLYKRYGISGADDRVTEWLAAQFTGEDPIGDVTPHRVIARMRTKDDCVYYQLSDSQYIRVDANGIEVLDNGEHGVLFESGQVEALDVATMLTEYQKNVDNYTNKTIPCYWSTVLSSVRLKDHKEQKTITALLYYMSPWLYRWRGMQLPLEMLIGESGSGKSTLCEHRLNVITGQPRLRNAPQDLKDWHASITNSGGLHVTDNVQLLDKMLRHRLSDEICRIITEPTPAIEQRKYFTNADLVRIPIHTVFAITAIQQPFQNADIIQRSIITELDKLSVRADGNPIEVTYDSEWRNTQLSRFGGREGWVAHHLYVLHRFFQLAQQKWSREYIAKHRLINFEQSMKLMAELFDFDAEWIAQYLSGTVDKALSESDWTFEGLKAYVAYHCKYMPTSTSCTAQQIADWATTQEEFQKCEVLTNSRRLGRYLTTHKSMAASSIGLVDMGVRNNRQVFRIVHTRI